MPSEASGSEVTDLGAIDIDLPFDRGVVFNDGVHTDGVAAVTVRHSQYIEELEMHYRDGHHDSHGCYTGKFAKSRVDHWEVPDGDEIVSVRYRTEGPGKGILALQFATNSGKESRMFGGSKGGGSLKMERGCKLIGLSGVHGQVLGKLKFVWDFGEFLQEWGDGLTHEDVFDDGPHHRGVEQVVVRHSKFVWGLEFTYHDGFSAFHGAEQGFWSCWQVPEGERIVCVRTWSDDGLRFSGTTGLQFVTDKGTTSEIFGSAEGEVQSDIGFNLIGLRGCCGQVIGKLDLRWDSGVDQVAVVEERRKTLLPVKRGGLPPRRMYIG